VTVTLLPVGGAGKEGCSVLIFDPKYVTFYLLKIAVSN